MAGQHRLWRQPWSGGREPGRERRRSAVAARRRWTVASAAPAVPRSTAAAATTAASSRPTWMARRASASTISARTKCPRRRSCGDRLRAADVGPAWLMPIRPTPPPGGGGCNSPGCAIQAENYEAILDPDNDGNMFTKLSVADALGEQVIKAPDGGTVSLPGTHRNDRHLRNGVSDAPARTRHTIASGASTARAIAFTRRIDSA